MIKYLILLTLLVGCGNIRDFKVGDCLLMRSHREFSPPIFIKIIKVGKVDYLYYYYLSDLNSRLLVDIPSSDSKVTIEAIFNRVGCND